MDPCIEKVKAFLTQYPRYRKDVRSVTELHEPTPNCGNAT